MPLAVFPITANQDTLSYKECRLGCFKDILFDGFYFSRGSLEAAMWKRIKGDAHLGADFSPD